MPPRCAATSRLATRDNHTRALVLLLLVWRAACIGVLPFLCSIYSVNQHARRSHAHPTGAQSAANMCAIYCLAYTLAMLSASGCQRLHVGSSFALPHGDGWWWCSAQTKKRTQPSVLYAFSAMPDTTDTSARLFVVCCSQRIRRSLLLFYDLKVKTCTAQSLR